ncbi:hypothetical protein JCM8547_004013 [Rhodosporidiobolus lusitaniae]
MNSSSSQAGPSSPTFASSSFPSPSRSTMLPVESYDSPLKERHAPGDSSYSHGGQETDLAEVDVGGEGLQEAATRSTPRRDKGKGKAVDEGDYGRVELDDRRSPDEQLEDPEPEEVDEEAEARRIQENLALWSRAETKRRAEVRRSSTFVTPSFPSPPPVPIPSASNLIRRTSTLLRTASKRRGNARDFAGLDAEEMELGGTGEITPVKGDGVGGRRGRRKLSVVIDSGRDGTSASTHGLPRVGEEEDEPDPARTPTASSHTHPHPDTTPSSTSRVAALSPPLNNPFSPSNASFVSLASTKTAASSRAAKTGSRFVEDLPALSLSPTSEAPHSQTLAGGNPFGTPTTPTGGASLPFSTRHPPASPFVDTIVVTSPFASSHSHSQHLPPHLDPRPPLHSHPSQATFASTTFSTASSSDPYPRSRSPSPSPSRASLALTHQSLQYPNTIRRRPSSTFCPSPTSSPNPNQDYRSAAVARGLDLDLDREGGKRQVGLLDWLLCGCFRAGGEDAGDEGRQQGRTNPNE